MLALIIPISELGGGVPTHPIAQPPNVPTHPIVLPPLPPGSELPPNVGGTPEHPIYYPPGASQGPGFPTNPIAPGGPPLGIWGGAPAYPDHALPGQPPHVSHPIVLPDTPEHPIAQPPGQVWPPIASLHTKTITLAWLPGVGYKWIVVEPSVPTPTA